MTEKHEISGLAVASLVFGLLFFIPFVSGVLALVFGIKSYSRIRQSDGYILGKKIAISGLVLSGIQLLFWGMVFFSGLLYRVDVNEQAVVTHSGAYIKQSYPGFHTKIPFFEKVYYYPKYKQFEFESDPIKLILKNKEISTVKLTAKWTICDVEKAFNTFHSNFDENNTTSLIISLIKLPLKVYSHDRTLAELTNPDDNYKKLYEESKFLLNKSGICLIKYDTENYVKLFVLTTLDKS